MVISIPARRASQGPLTTTWSDRRRRWWGLDAVRYEHAMKSRVSCFSSPKRHSLDKLDWLSRVPFVREAWNSNLKSAKCDTMLQTVCQSIQCCKRLVSYKQPNVMQCCKWLISCIRQNMIQCFKMAHQSIQCCKWLVGCILQNVIQWCKRLSVYIYSVGSGLSVTNNQMWYSVANGLSVDTVLQMAHRLHTAKCDTVF